MPILDLPRLEVSIFARMSALARAHEAVNLGQGFPDFDPDPALIERLSFYAAAGYNQYAPMAGVPILLQRIAEKIEHCYGVQVDPQAEITVCSGATQGLWTAIQVLLQAGDEAIVFDPAYDSYVPAIESRGARAVRLPLEGPDFRPDWGAFAKTLNDRTRLVIINNPHNPTGKCWCREDLEALAFAIRGRDILLISDEVYEHMVFDGKRHCSALQVEGLRNRSLVMSSFGKTFHVTGWKVGYVVASEELSNAFRAWHQYTVFTVNTPAQYAIADVLAKAEAYETLPSFFERKRNLMRDMLEGSAWECIESEGSYFMLVDYGRISLESDVGFAERLIREAGVATIPLSPFYGQEGHPRERTLLRLCFGKKDETIRAGVERLLAYGES